MKRRISQHFMVLMLQSRIAFLFLKFLIKRIKEIADIFYLTRIFIKQICKAKRLLSPNKVVYKNGKYYWHLYTPGFPSKSYEYALNLGISKTLEPDNHDLGLLIIAITKKCSLNCDHCFEWNEINKKDVLTEEIIDQKITAYFHNGFFGQVFLTGGEPLNRYAILPSLIKRHKDKCEFWIISSGLGFDRSKAKELRMSGLIGVIISLDDYDCQKHDKFRGFAGSYNAALKAIEHAENEGLLTTLSLCPTKENLSRDFLDQYMSLAKSLHVSFVKILEPRAEGKFENKNVQLESGEIQILEKFYFEYNNLKRFRDFPLIVYPDYNKRAFGCEGMDWYAYMDTNGDLFPCPFCKEQHKQCTNNKEKIALFS